MVALKLTSDSGSRYFNSDRIETWQDRAGRSEITMSSGERWIVDISPDDLAKALDPENACPDPTCCSYTNHYLVYGPADLTHGGWHAAERLGRQHFAECKRETVCATCTDWEHRLRA